MFTLTDGTQAKPILVLSVEDYNKSPVEKVYGDKESFEFSNVAGFCRATKAMLTRFNAKFGGVLQPQQD